MERRVVVTGLGVVSPVGNNIDEMWASIKAGKHGIAPITRFDTEGHKVTLAAEVKDFDFGDRRAAKRLDIADQYDTIKDRAWIYQNEELLALNKKEILSFPLSTDTKNPDSTIWIGKEATGEIILSVFNRDAEEKEVEIDFKQVLLCRAASVRDLWMHEDLGEMKSFHTMLPPHGCRVLKLSERS